MIDIAERECWCGSTSMCRSKDQRIDDRSRPLLVGAAASSAAPPEVASLPAVGHTGSMRTHGACHGTTRSISAKNYSAGWAVRRIEPRRFLRPHRAVTALPQERLDNVLYRALTSVSHSWALTTWTVSWSAV